jgi:endonuclease III
MAGAKILSDTDSNKLIAALSKAYPDSHYYLDFKTPIDLVVAAILSAQTRDQVTNAVTPKLFAKYKTAKDYAAADPDELYQYISRVSFGGNKAKSIINTMKIIDEKYNGKVPNKMEQLLELPGIGRKTANTILINAYGIVEGIPVDTWVIKLAPRLGLSAGKNPEEIERDLMKKLDRKYWHNVTYIFKNHGRALCDKVPVCSKCPAQRICPKNGVTKSL